MGKRKQQKGIYQLLVKSFNIHQHNNLCRNNSTISWKRLTRTKRNSSRNNRIKLAKTWISNWMWVLNHIISKLCRLTYYITVKFRRSTKTQSWATKMCVWKCHR
jgi:hypothetical protein